MKWVELKWIELKWTEMKRMEMNENEWNRTEKNKLGGRGGMVFEGEMHWRISSSHTEHTVMPLLCNLNLLIIHCMWYRSAMSCYSSSSDTNLPCCPSHRHHPPCRQNPKIRLTEFSNPQLFTQITLQFYEFLQTEVKVTRIYHGRSSPLYTTATNTCTCTIIAYVSLNPLQDLCNNRINACCATCACMCCWHHTYESQLLLISCAEVYEKVFTKQDLSRPPTLVTWITGFFFYLKILCWIFVRIVPSS
jgi:hypothetical protein